MKQSELLKALERLERMGILVLATRDLHKLFPSESEKAMEKSLQRMCASGVLIRATRGLYVHAAAARRSPRWVLEHIALALRPGEITYVSLESALSEYGAISQIPMQRLTLMTTGSSGLVKTPWGTLEYTHTKKSRLGVMAKTLTVPDRPLLLARLNAAAKDLVRVGRNTEMMDWGVIEQENKADDEAPNVNKNQKRDASFFDDEDED